MKKNSLIIVTWLLALFPSYLFAVSLNYTSVKDFGAVGDAIANDYVAIQNAVNQGATYLPGGKYKLQSPVVISSPIHLHGDGANTIINSENLNTGPIFKLSPKVGTDPKNWLIRDFKISNSGLAADVFSLDISTAGQYISKLEISNIIAAQTTGAFINLLNKIPNIDGLFTSVFQDNWSMNGYYLNNIGDSVTLQRNTTTGLGIGYYINQLGSASSIVIRDGNCTSAGGGLNVVKGTNITFENMQVETPSTFTGNNNAAVSAASNGKSLITNLRIINNNINTHGNPDNCIYLNFTDNATIDGNTLFSHPSKGTHIVIDAGARNTYIGLNKYFSSVDGTEISPRITDNGVGTMGIWKNATLESWTKVISTDGFPVGYFKTKDGIVLLRGNLKGSALTAGQTLFNLPQGFRPSAKFFTKYIPNSTTSNIALQILPTGEVQLLTPGIFSVFLDGLTFSTR